MRPLEHLTSDTGPHPCYRPACAMIRRSFLSIGAFLLATGCGNGGTGVGTAPPLPEACPASVPTTGATCKGPQVCTYGDTVAVCSAIKGTWTIETRGEAGPFTESGADTGSDATDAADGDAADGDAAGDATDGAATDGDAADAGGGDATSDTTVPVDAPDASIDAPLDVDAADAADAADASDTPG